MKTQKISSYLILLIAGLLLSLSACKKDKIYTIEGKWEGTQSVIGFPGSSYNAFKIEALNNAVTWYTSDANHGEVTGTGTWTLIGTTFQAILHYSVDPNTIYIFSAQFDPKSGKLLNGTWGTSPSSTDGGTWTMTKQ
jgi:hypothetical protein